MSMIMNSLTKERSLTHDRKSYITNDSSGLSKIHNQKINISIWQRQLDSTLIDIGKSILDRNNDIQLSEVIEPQNVLKMLSKEFGSSEKTLPLFNDISNLVDLFCNVFDEKRAWVRLDSIDKPMCPRFHTDYVKCRLVTTYVGPATQWLPHHLVDRSKLGHGNQGLPDDRSGLFGKSTDIEQLDVGDVAFLKGESWKGNNGSGLVHRSPHEDKGYKRLYMTIDFLETYINIYRTFSKDN